MHSIKTSRLQHLLFSKSYPKDVSIFLADNLKYYDYSLPAKLNIMTQANKLAKTVPGKALAPAAKTGSSLATTKTPAATKVVA